LQKFISTKSSERSAKEKENIMSKKSLSTCRCHHPGSPLEGTLFAKCDDTKATYIHGADKIDETGCEQIGTCGEDLVLCLA
jgi:hypothetical protein